MHEAGHAVVAFKLGEAFRDISIVPDKDTLGRVHLALPGQWFRPDSAMTRRERALIERRVMILLAGWAAEDAWCRTVSGKPRNWAKQLRDGADSDAQKVVDFAWYVTSSSRETSSYVERLNQRVLLMVGPEGHASSLVYRLADELERTQQLAWRKAKALLTAAEVAIGDN
jgi:hypothetical protein